MYSAAVQLVSGAQVRSDVAVGAAVSNCVAEQTASATQTVSEVAVAATVS
jgi:hypothetical protein